MSKESNNQGRAYEYVCLLTLEREIRKVRPVKIEENSSYYAAMRAWQAIDDELKAILVDSAAAAVKTIFDLTERLDEFYLERANDAENCKGCLWPSSFEAELKRGRH